jgi:acetylornithine/N-succinyldiaminopimelate aminotransferase
LLILDEIQVGFGRTGTLWAFEQYHIVPDVLLLGKALGGGMPLGAFISSKENLLQLASNPVLGHITTFGGHPVSCAAGLAGMQALLEEKMLESVAEKEALFLKRLQHPKIKEVRSKGLIMAIELESYEQVLAFIKFCTQPSSRAQIVDCNYAGVFTDWFLFAANSVRLVPPLTITRSEIEAACTIMLAALDIMD